MRRGCGWWMWIAVGILVGAGCKEGPGDEEWPDPVAFSLAIDCGWDGTAGDDDEGEDDDDGELDARDDDDAVDGPFVADVPYSDGLGYGHEGGEPASEWFPWVVGATPAPFTEAYRQRRDGHTAYRVDVPQAGPYVVTLGFCERSAHGPGRRLHEVRAEGAVIVHELDVFAVAGQDQAWIERREVVVEDGTLDLEFATSGGLPTSLATLAVERANPHEDAPAVPGTVEALDSYGAVVVRWDAAEGDPGYGWDPSVAYWDVDELAQFSPFGDVTGYEVQRKAVGTDEFEGVSPAGWPLPYWIDRTAEPGQRYEYRVRSWDVWGNVSPATAIATGEARALADSPLPVYEIRIGDAELSALQADPYGDAEVDLTFVVEGVEYAGDGRFRGASTRGLAKKSWRVELDEPLPDGRHKLDLKAEWGDWTQLQELVSYDLFWMAGNDVAADVPASAAMPVNLVVNGVYDGTRLDVQRIDGDFLAISGRDPDGDVYRGGGFGDLPEDPAAIEQQYRRRAGTGDVEHLLAFLEFHNRAHRDEFAAELDVWTELDALIEWFAVHAALARPETEADDYFYVRDSVTGRWEVIAWDENNGNLGLSLFWPVGEPAADPVHMSLWYATSAEMSWWHLLHTRILEHPALRATLAARIDEIVGELMLGTDFVRRVRDRVDLLEDEVHGDPFKYPWAVHDLFDQGQPTLVDAIELRADQLSEALDTLGSMPDEPLVINEFGAYACAAQGSCEPYGFVELHNRGDAAVELGGLWLSDSMREPLRCPLEGELAAGAYLLVELGPPDAADGCRLDVAGGELGLFAGGEGDDGFRLVDPWWYGRLTPALGYGRTADGVDDFGFLLAATPGAANTGPTTVSPRLGTMEVTPDGAALSVTIRAEHPAGMASVECVWRAGGEGGRVALLDDGQHGDGAAGDGIFGGLVDGLPGGASEAQLYVEAVSVDGVVQVDPRIAPARLRVVPL